MRIDPWLESTIRLADRQGVFSRRIDSKVQQLCLHILLFLEAEDAQRKDEQAFKMALIANDPAKWIPFFQRQGMEEELRREGAFFGEAVPDEELLTILQSMEPTTDAP